MKTKSILRSKWIITTLLGMGALVRAEPSFELDKVIIEPEVQSIMTAKWQDEFKHVEYPQQWLNHVITVTPGESIQEAIDSASEAGGGVVHLKAGVHPLEQSLILKSKVSIVGEGRERTILQQTAEMSGSGFEAQPEPQITDVLIKDLWLKGIHQNKANGIYISGKNESRHARIMMQNINLTDWSAQGVHMKRTDHIIMDRSNLQFNGSGDGLYHNVYFLYNKFILQSDLDMSFPVLGKGCKYTSVEHMLAQRCTIRDCVGNGIQSDHEQAGYLFFHKYTISGCGRVAMWFPCEHYYDKFNYTEDPKYAPQKVILNRCEIVDNTWGAMWRMVADSYVINSTFDNQKIDMGLLKCDVTFENSTFKKGNKIFTDVDQWPADVELLW
ncbi:glycosyl hydrolase family 28-related protein [Pontiellaceae bacterium B12219]|nr:glycosyl hydrolase family 28-related protein [Pontiellaceae bacterium B12219]